MFTTYTVCFFKEDNNFECFLTIFLELIDMKFLQSKEIQKKEE